MKPAEVARKAVELLKKRGAEAAVVVERRRSVEVEVRERKVEKLQESSSASLSVAVYVEGRYSSHNTSDLAEGSLEKFLDGAVAMTRVLEADGFRSLPDPRWYAGQAQVDLQRADPTYEAVDAAALKKLGFAIEGVALEPAGAAPEGGAAIQSVSAGAGASRSELARATSNGFFGEEASTSFHAGAGVTMREGLKRPEDGWWLSGRKRAELGDPAAIGREAGVRARMRLGSKKVAGGAMTVIVENRVAGRLLGFLIGAASAPALQQKRSFLDGKIGEKVASELLTITDEPHIPGGMGSRLFDREGIAAKRMPVLEAGVLRNYYVDWYYGRKLGLDPTTGDPSNLVVAPGKRSLADLEKGVQRGILVTSFLGGDSNGLTGDFSVGIQGVLIEKGERVQSVGEMNLAGNHKELWGRLAEVGGDPWLRSSTRSPSLVFEGVSVAGA